METRSIGDPPGDRDPDARSEAERVLDELRSLLEDLHERTGLPLTLDSNLTAELGLDSLAIVELHDRLEHAFGVRLSEEVLASASTPGEWTAAVLAALGASAPATLPPPPIEARPAGAPWPREARTLVDALHWHVAAHPEQVSLRILGPGGSVEALTYRELASDAAKAAAGLLALGLQRGERVGLMLPTGRDYFVDFLGAALAGGVPLPLYPPARLSMIEEHLRRAARLLANGEAAILVTVPEARSLAHLVRLQVPSLRSVVTPASLLAGGAPGMPLPGAEPGATGLIQYTSGSTGDPKGVVLTHAQLVANIVAMGEAAEVSSADVFVSWLPLYHDMGLIGAWLAPMFFGLPLVVMSPLAFLAHPAAWLEAVSTHRGTLSAAPNFAFAWCAERIADTDLTGIDLSSWRIAFNGSEPVTEPVIGRFVDRFGPLGFRPEAMCPAYGLAEVGVGVAFSPLGRAPRVDVIDRDALDRHRRAEPVAAGAPGARAVVGCGHALAGYALRIVGRHGELLGERREGRVECTGPSATAGYAANEPATRALSRDGWLDTGDLGYLADGELFLTGRVKDVVIRAGHNLHPEELEAEIATLPGIEAGGAAVFGVGDPERGTESLVVALETRLPKGPARDALDEKVAGRVLAVAGVLPDRVVAVGPGQLPRTASGKIRRSATAQAYEQGALGCTRPSVRLQLARFAWSGRREAMRTVGEVAAEAASGLYVWLVVFVVGGPLFIVLQLPAPLQWRWRVARKAAGLLRALVGIVVHVDGALPDEGPAIVVANHASFIDGAVLFLSSPRSFDFVASSEIAELPVIGRLLRRLGCTFVPRGHAERSAESLGLLRATLERGGRLVIFPEGSIERAPGLRPFHLGAFAAAAATGCPVVPVGIRGASGVLPRGSFLVRPGRIEVRVGAPLSPAGGELADQVELRDRARDAVGRLAASAGDAAR